MVAAVSVLGKCAVGATIVVRLDSLPPQERKTQIIRRLSCNPVSPILLLLIAIRMFEGDLE